VRPSGSGASAPTVAGRVIVTLRKLDSTQVERTQLHSRFWRVSTTTAYGAHSPTTTTQNESFRTTRAVEKKLVAALRAREGLNEHNERAAE